MRRILFWGLTGATLAVYATMLGWSLPTISAGAGGLAPFDMRPAGYGQAEAVQFLSALSAEARLFYRGVQQRLDIAYPALLSLTLLFALLALLPRRLGAWRFGLALPVLSIAICDYLENHAVAALLAADPAGVTAELVAEASRWTVLKSGISTVAMSAIVLLLAGRAALALIARLRPAVSPAA